ncbi:helix-turn-helix domain-containing protein [Sandaracinus amylolyticus]|uniref:Transcriptional regulator, AraC family protein n=1 Tax=Sandaracinus amylolyticus TaxID=927083 RepID=A0A0F6W0L9_9BACT|nr:AraC family transcriptional regulator [Sandaracinus amylolyticus]AKF04405.1 Transcriptional regulator, AraC family protein [Sandaracinus amylolyticus]
MERTARAPRPAPSRAALSVRWSRDAALEVLEVDEAPSRSWSFVWPARVMVQARSAGVRFRAGRQRGELACGAVLVIDGPGAHVVLHTDRGASFRVVFGRPEGTSPGAALEARVVDLDVDVDVAPSTLDERAREALRSAPPAPRRLDARLARACAYIAQTLADELRLEDLAAVAGVHRCHLCRVFAQHLGLSPLRFRAQVRVARARALLAAGADCISVAHEVGYCDQSHFNRSFREITGTTPGAYARAVRIACDDGGARWLSAA